MKTTILIISFLISLVSFQAFSQEIASEGDVSTLVTNIHASLNNRLDDNGNACGILFVKSTIPDLSFSGNVIGDVEYKNAVYNVYLSPGTKKIKVSDSKGHKLNLDLPKIAQKTAYEVTIISKSGYGSLQISTIPSGADVYIESEFGLDSIGQTPIEDDLKFITGKHNVIIKKNNYVDYNIEIEIKDNKTTKLNNIKLKSGDNRKDADCDKSNSDSDISYGWLYIDEMIPEGEVRVYFNGTYECIGILPLNENIKLGVGKHIIKIKAGNKLSKKYIVNIKKNQITKLKKIEFKEYVPNDNNDKGHNESRQSITDIRAGRRGWNLPITINNAKNHINTQRQQPQRQQTKRPQTKKQPYRSPGRKTPKRR